MARRQRADAQTPTGNHILQTAISVLTPKRGIKLIKARGKDKRAHVKLDLLFFHLMVYRLCFTGLHTLQTLTTVSTIHTALCLFYGLLLSETKVDFLPVPFPLIGG